MEVESPRQEKTANNMFRKRVSSLVWAEVKPCKGGSAQFSRSVMSNSLLLSHFSRVRLCATPWITAHQASLSITKSRSSLKLMSIELVRPSSHLNPSQNQGLFQWVSSSHEVAKVLEFQLQHHYFQRNPRDGLLQNGLIGSPCSPRESQESSPTPQFKSINSLVLSLLHSPTLISIHDYWKNHSLD